MFCTINAGSRNRRGKKNICTDFLHLCTTNTTANHISYNACSGTYLLMPPGAPTTVAKSSQDGFSPAVHGAAIIKICQTADVGTGLRPARRGRKSHPPAARRPYDRVRAQKGPGPPLRAAWRGLGHFAAVAIVRRSCRVLDRLKAEGQFSIKDASLTVLCDFK